MSAHQFEPITIDQHSVSDKGETLTASVTVVMYHDEALKLAMSTSYAVRPGDRCSGPLSLRAVGATLAKMEA
jgi:hypothetical protein